MILFEYKNGQTLHAYFEGYVNVFRGKSKNENCSSMSLGSSLKISASLDELNGFYGLNGKTGLLLRDLLACFI